MKAEDTMLAIQDLQLGASDLRHFEDAKLHSANVLERLELENVGRAKNKRRRDPVFVLPNIRSEATGVRVVDLPIALSQLVGVGLRDGLRNDRQRQLKGVDGSPSLLVTRSVKTVFGVLSGHLGLHCGPSPAGSGKYLFHPSKY